MTWGVNYKADIWNGPSNDYFKSTYSGQPYETIWFVSSYCLPAGTYQVTVWYGDNWTGPLSGPSNTITLVLP